MPLDFNKFRDAIYNSPRRIPRPLFTPKGNFIGYDSMTAPSVGSGSSAGLVPPSVYPQPGSVIQVTPSTKPGWQTSEFWISLLTILGTVASSVSPNQHTGLAIGGAALTSVAYTLGRSWVKSS